MIAAIMQPYFFPYIGYFQLMNAVDVFVFYDDAQYMKGGWINRNRILVNSEPAWLTLPTRKASVKAPINQRQYVLEGRGIEVIKQRLNASYAKAPAYDEVSPPICELFHGGDSNVASFNTRSLKAVAQRLGISCKFMTSSEIDKPADLRGEARVLDICRRIGATMYINPIGGIALYDAAAFAESGIDLRFLRSEPTSYTQFGHPHVPFLSIIDVLMFNPTAVANDMLGHYQLIESAANVLT